MKADLVPRDGKVITVDRNFSIEQSVAVTNGKISALGTNGEIASLIGDATWVIDPQGKTVLPGINESHLHAPFFGATRPPLALDLKPPAVASIRDIIKALQCKVAECGNGEWIRGCGWEQGALVECRTDLNKFPRKWDLDPVSPLNPVVFMDFSGHMLLASSKALQLAGITKDTPDPESREMERDPVTGDPTGIFKEPGAQSLISMHVPLLSREEKKQALLTALEHLNANGVTSLTEPLETIDEIEVLMTIVGGRVVYEA